MRRRKLTGNWFLRKRFFGGYRVFVEAEIINFNDEDFSPDPPIKTWDEASVFDLFELGIKIG